MLVWELSAMLTGPVWGLALLLTIAGGTTWIDEMTHPVRNNVKPQTAPVSITDGPQSNIIDHNTC